MIIAPMYAFQAVDSFVQYALCVYPSSVSGCEDRDVSWQLLKERVLIQQGYSDVSEPLNSLPSTMQKSACLSQWVYIMIKVASKVVHHASEPAPLRPLSTHQMSCSLSRSLMECGGQSSDLFCITPEGRMGVMTQVTFGSSISSDVFLIE